LIRRLVANAITLVNFERVIVLAAFRCSRRIAEDSDAVRLRGLIVVLWRAGLRVAEACITAMISSTVGGSAG
jgi:hypothetical protein